MGPHKALTTVPLPPSPLQQSFAYWTVREKLAETLLSMSSDPSKRAATPSARILERVREDATDLALLATVTSHDWKLLSDKNDTQLYEMTGESLSSKVSTVQTFGKGGGGNPSEFYLVRAATTIRADVNSMLDVLRASKSEDFRAVMKKIFGIQFESGAVVKSLSCTTPPPYAPNPDSTGGSGGWQLFSEDDGYSANWATLRAFTKLGGLDGHRDFTMVCYQDVFERAYMSDKLQRIGRRMARDPHRPKPVTGSRLIGAHTFSSMNFKDMPELPKSSKTDRLQFRNSGVIVEELVEEDSESPRVRVSLLLSLMPTKLVLKEVSQSPRMRVALAAGHEVAKKHRKWLQTLALGVSHLAEAAKPALTMEQLGKMTWTESDHCFMCLKTFRTYRRRHHCRFCGEAVCGSCSGFVNMGLFDVSEVSSDSITVGHRKLDLRVASDGSSRSARSENVSLNASKDNTEELMETRGCNRCVSELQMNLTMVNHARSQQDLSLYSTSSSGSLSQLVKARLKNQSVDNNDDIRNSECSSTHGPPPPYPGRENDFERDQVMPMRAGDYQQYQQYAGQKMSFSTISSSNPTPSSFSASDGSLSAFLARDPDILSLNGLTLSPGGSVAPSTVIDDDEHMDLVFNCNSRPSCVENRTSYATTAATNECSNHSQFNYANMTPQEVEATRLIRDANARVNGRPPLNARRHQPQYQQDHEHSPMKLAKKKVYHMPGGLSPSHSQKSSYSSGSTHSDLIQLNAPTKAPVASTKMDFVVFDDRRQTEVIKRADSAKDMIPLEF